MTEKMVIPKEFDNITKYLDILDESLGVNRWVNLYDEFDADFVNKTLRQLMLLSSPEASNVSKVVGLHRSLLIASLTAMQILIDEKGGFGLQLVSANTEPYRPDLLGPALKVLKFGAKKYGVNNWLKGDSFDRRSNHASMFRHLAEHYSGVVKDHESGLPPIYHLLSRALMEYTLDSRGKL